MTSSCKLLRRTMRYNVRNNVLFEKGTKCLSGFYREEAVFGEKLRNSRQMNNNKKIRKDSKMLCYSEKMTNALCCSKVSGHYKQIKGTTVFYSLQCYVETAFAKGQNVLHVMAEIGQHCMKNLYGSINTTLNATAKEHKPAQHETIN